MEREEKTVTLRREGKKRVLLIYTSRIIDGAVILSHAFSLPS